MGTAVINNHRTETKHQQTTIYKSDYCSQMLSVYLSRYITVTYTTVNIMVGEEEDKEEEKRREEGIGKEKEKRKKVY